MQFHCESCGARSMNLAAFDEALWRELHRQHCAPTSTSAVAPDFPVDVDTLRARAARFKPIAVPVPQLDVRELWGAPPLGGFTR